MDLEQINSEYLKLQQDLQMAEKQVDYFEKHRDQLLTYHLDNITILQGKIIEAKRESNSEAQQKYEQEIAKEKESVENLKNVLEECKENAVSIRNKIDDRYNEIKNDPNMQKHLCEVMEKRYERKLSKLDVEKKELESKRDRRVDLQQLVAQHPALMNNLKGIMSARKQMNDLESELKAMTQQQADGKVIYANEARAQEIKANLMPQLQEKLNVNKRNLLDYIARNGIGISEMDIDEVSSEPVLDSNENIDVNATLNRNIKGLNKQIKGVNKDMRNNEIALNNVRSQLVTLEAQLHPQEPMQPEQVVEQAQAEPRNSQPEWEDINSNSGNQEQGQQDPVVNPQEPVQPEPQNNTQPAEKDTKSDSSNQEPVTPRPKWYQFIKRFKMWNENRKQSRLMQPEKIEAEMIDPDTGDVIANNAQPTSPEQQVVNPIMPHEAQPAPVQQQPEQAQSTPDQSQTMPEQAQPMPEQVQPTPVQAQTNQQQLANSLQYEIVQKRMNELMQSNMQNAKNKRKQEDREER